MRIVLAYDQSGRIVDVIRAYHVSDNIPHPFANLSEEHFVLSIDEPEGELREMDLFDVQNKFVVDVATRTLVKRE